MAEIYGVLLAAGFSTRFGSSKLLAEINDRPLIEYSAAALSPCDHIIAVARANDDAVLSALDALDIDCVNNAHPERGMGYSIACAVNASLDSKGWCLLPADMPYVKASTTQQLIKVLQAGSVLAAPFYQGHRGHPVAFSSKFRSALSALDGDSGARSIVERNAEALTVVMSDDNGVLLDVDSPEQLVVNTKI
jgi:molybdenum cofactor cytidylyltransferase